MPSFDIVSKPNWPEIDNALNQATERNRPALRLQGYRDELEKHRQNRDLGFDR